ncbi:MAG TPA: ATP-binding cassette domain-containing protein [Terriglobia bacterium]|nr:ATP-binding cassette domain-containing protein [Terriglobia bacterium]
MRPCVPCGEVFRFLFGFAGLRCPPRGGDLKLSIENVGKLYSHKVWALRNFSLELGPGVLGLLGPNGAGKTTLMNILATITRATEGSVTWNGADLQRHPDAVRAALGYLPQDFGIYPNLNAVEFLEYFAAVKGLDAVAASRRIEELLVLVNLADVRKRPNAKSHVFFGVVAPPVQAGCLHRDQTVSFLAGLKLRFRRGPAGSARPDSCPHPGRRSPPGR